MKAGDAMFQDKDFEIKYLIFEKIALEDMPIGAVLLNETLKQNHHQLSETAVGRLLRSYRSEGYLERIKNQGHVLTDQGREFFKQLLAQRELYTAMDKLVRKGVIYGQNFLHILIVRRAIEIEASYRAAQNATEKEITLLEQIIQKQYVGMETGEDYSDESASFHRTIIAAAKIPLLVTFYNLIGLSNQWHNFFIGTFRLYNAPMNQEHERILYAIKNREPEKAAKFMSDHMDQVILNAEKLFLKK